MLFKEPPQNFRPDMEVVGCFIEHGGKLLVVKRTANKAQGGTWGLPGGKLSKDESMQRAVQREVLEETGLPLEEKDIQYIAPVYVKHSDYHFVYHIFSARLPKKPNRITLNPTEHTAFDWFTTKELLALDGLIEDFDSCIKLYEESDLK